MTARTCSLRIFAVAALCVGALTACTAPTGHVDQPSSESPAAADCLNPDGDCLGVVSAGTHQSAHFDPAGTGEPGQLTYDVPEGWANSLDHRYGYWLQPADPYVAQSEDHWGGIYVWADAALAIQDGSCAEVQQPGGPTDAAGIVAALRSVPGLTLTDLPPVTISGVKAIVVETAVDSTATTGCEGSVPLIAGRDGVTDDYMWATGEPEGCRLYFLDLGAAGTAVVVINSPRADFDALVAAAEPVIATFEFRVVG